MSLILPAIAAGLIGISPQPPLVFPKPAIIRPAADLAMMPGFPVMLGLPKPFLSFVNSATSSGATIVMPTVAANDICILFDFGFGSPAPSLVTPSGFTNLQNMTSGATDARLASCMKVCTGSESGATLTGMDGTDTDTKRLVVFRVNRGVWQAPTDLNIGNATTALSNQVVTPAAAPSIVVCFYGSANGTVATRGFSGATADAEVGSGRGYVKYKLFQLGDATPDITCSKSNDADLKNGMASFTLNVTY